MPALRGHHLVCLHFFRGEGYNEEFVENLMTVLKTAENEVIEVLHGSDDVCAKCLYLDHAGCKYTEDAEEGIGEMDRKALDLLELSQGMKVKWVEVKEKIPEIFRVWHRAYCITCSWKRACEGHDSYRRLKKLIL
jgi:hypothetical protein